MVERFAELGAEARIEAEPAHGTYWWPLGHRRRAGRARRDRRACAGAGCSARSWARSAPPGSPTTSRPASGRLRRLLPKRTTYNVVCELGPAEAERTVVVVAHHDAAHSGLVFHPEMPKIADRLGLIERTDTSPPLMAPVVGGPILAALGALTGRRLLAKLGVFLGLGSAAAMAEIGARKAVPGANDNGTAVVSLLALAERLVEEPPEDLRVILLSAGSEESFSEGIKAFGERHFPQLPRESTFFLCLESIGSPHLLVLRGEGFLKMREYPPRALALMDGLAEELGIWLYPNLRLHNGTDGLEPLAAGYETAVDLRLHRPQAARPTTTGPTTSPRTSTSARVADGVRLIEAAIRRLDERWLVRPDGVKSDCGVGFRLYRVRARAYA